MGSPALGWTSVFGENDVADIFAGGERSIDFGWLSPARRDSAGELLADGSHADNPAKLISSGARCSSGSRWPTTSRFVTDANG